MELEKEYQTYKEHKDELVSTGLGKFVLIKGKTIVDTFSAYEDALKEGLKQFGNVPFFIHKIERDETVNFFFHGVAA